MSTHRNCPHCGTDWQVTINGIDAATMLELFGPSDRQFPHWDITFPVITGIEEALIAVEEPADPSIHLAPNHQDYTPNHRKQRRGKFKRSGR